MKKQDIVLLIIVCVIIGIFYNIRLKSDSVMEQFEKDKTRIEALIKNDNRFTEIGFRRSTNYKHKALINGTVKTKNDLDELKKLISSLKPVNLDCKGLR